MIPAFAPTVRVPVLPPRARPRAPPPRRRPRPVLSARAPLSPPDRTPLHLAISTRNTAQIPALLHAHLSTHQPTLSLYRSALSACLCDPDALLPLLHLLLHRPPPALPRALLVSPLLALARAARWPDLLALLDRLSAHGPHVAPDARLLVSLANVAVDGRAYPRSLALLCRVRDAGFALGPVGFSVLLKCHGRAGNVAEVRRVVADLMRGQILVDSVLLNSAVDALVRCGDVVAAERLVRCERFAAVVDVQTFNTLIKGLSQAGLLRRAFAVVEEMRDAAVPPNDVTHNTLLHACANAGDFDAAWRMADAVAKGQGNAQLEVGQPPQLTIALTSLIAGLAESGRFEEAVALLNDMARRKAPPSDVTYAALISACFKRGAVKEAVRVYRDIPVELRSVGAVNAIVAGLCADGRRQSLQFAEKVVDELVSKRPKGGVRPNADTFNALLDGFMQVGMYAKAEKCLKAMEGQGCKPTIVSFTIMMKGYAGGKMFGKAKKMFREISRRGIEPDRVSLAAFVDTCARSGDTRSAFRVLEYMEKKGGTLGPDAQTYTPLIFAYMKTSDVKKARDTYIRMRKNQVPLNVYLVKLLTAHVVRLATAVLKGEDRRVSLDAVVMAGANIIRDAHADGVDDRVLRTCRRQMLKVCINTRAKRHFRGLDFPEIRSASETIFEKHGWNDIDSRWRVL